MEHRYLSLKVELENGMAIEHLEPKLSEILTLGTLCWTFCSNYFIGTHVVHLASFGVQSQIRRMRRLLWPANGTQPGRWSNWTDVFVWERREFEKKCCCFLLLWNPFFVFLDSHCEHIPEPPVTSGMKFVPLPRSKLQLISRITLRFVWMFAK